MSRAQYNLYNSLWFVQCAFCSKAFLNASFLQAHLARRHAESGRSQIPSQTEPAPADQSSQNPELVRQLEELRDKLRQTESQLVEERNRRNEKHQTVSQIFARSCTECFVIQFVVRCCSIVRV